MTTLNINCKLIYFLVNLYDTYDFRPRPSAEPPYGRFAASTHRCDAPHKTFRKGGRPVDPEAHKCFAHYSWEQIQRLASSIDEQIKNLLLLDEHPTCEYNRYLFHFNQECEQEYIQFFDYAGAQHQLKLRRPDLCELYLYQNLKMLLSWNKRKVVAQAGAKHQESQRQWHHVDFGDGIMVWPRKDTLDQCALKVAGTLYAIETPSS